MKIFKITFAILILVLSISCNKDEDDQETKPVQNSVFPIAVGNSWTYKVLNEVGIKEIYDDDDRLITDQNGNPDYLLDYWLNSYELIDYTIK